MARRKKTSAPDPFYLDKQREALLRKRRYTLLFNDSEIAAINQYCDKFSVHSRSTLFREAILSKVLSELDENHPTLF